MFAMLQITSSKRQNKDETIYDQEIADDLEKIRKYRNKICHSVSWEMTTEDFNNSVLDLIGVYIPNIRSYL